MKSERITKRGISLIVLVITIIIMIILASAVIISLNGGNIIGRANALKDSYNNSAEVEKMLVALTSAYKNDDVTEESIKEAVDKEYRTNTSSVKMFEDGAITILVESNKREYYVESNGNITVTELNAVKDTEGLSGAGTVANPYKINSIEDLVDFSTNISIYKNKYVELSRDLDFRSFASYREVNKELMDSLTSGTGFNPINSYNSTFDGKGHTIKNIYENYTSNYIGLFGNTSNGTTGIIQNLNITGKIKGNDYVAGICGKAMKKVVNCNNYVEVSGNEYVGGIQGIASAIENCENYGKIKGKQYIGGISGCNGVITLCKNYADIICTGDMCGGIAGHANGSIKKCANYGNIYGKVRAGGIGGHLVNGGEVTLCCNFGSVSGTQIVGGVVGHCWRSDYISNSYNMGDVLGTQDLGGLIGYFAKDYAGNNASFNCYTTGNVTGTNSKGAAIGYGENTAINSYCNYFYYLNTILNKGIGTKNDATGIVEGKTETQLKDDSMITLLNTNSGSTSETIWVKDTRGINNGYPILSWQIE